MAEDRRRRKGDRRRRVLLDATLRVVAAHGVAGVSQRAVAAAAGLPPSTVFYYFPTVDDLLVAALIADNDRCVADLTAITGMAALAALIADYARPGRAQWELWLMAARRPELRGEIDRWYAALDALAATLVADPAARPAFTAAVEGLLLRASLGPVDTAAVLRHFEADGDEN